MCEGGRRYIGCPPGNVIDIAWAEYGRKDNKLCNADYDSTAPELNEGTPCMGGKKAAVAAQ